MSRWKIWARFFRLPNLGTVPGDPLAGVAYATVTLGADNVHVPLISRAMMALAALALYMFGLADNDIHDCKDDRRTWIRRKDDLDARPLAIDLLTMREAKTARALCLAAFAVFGLAGAFPMRWWMLNFAVLAMIFSYNRIKEIYTDWGLWFMGLCRGLSAASGAATAYPPNDMLTDLQASQIGFFLAGWVVYTIAITYLGQEEEYADEPLPFHRYMWGLGVFFPFFAIIFFPTPEDVPLKLWFAPSAGMLLAYVAWCRAVHPLGRRHKPADRRKAVGRAVGAILLLQMGYFLAPLSWGWTLAAICLGIFARRLRRIAPYISGS
ncbi:MAG: hypothetical protein IJ802_02310 [Kiritimatiellae bacterium]|nr:hypothetical protein [Kiritimatiellia bacterium]